MTRPRCLPPRISLGGRYFYYYQCRCPHAKTIHTPCHPTISAMTSFFCSRMICPPLGQAGEYYRGQGAHVIDVRAQPSQRLPFLCAAQVAELLVLVDQNRAFGGPGQPANRDQHDFLQWDTSRGLLPSIVGSGSRVSDLVCVCVAQARVTPGDSRRLYRYMNV